MTAEALEPRLASPRRQRWPQKSLSRHLLWLSRLAGAAKRKRSRPARVVRCPVSCAPRGSDGALSDICECSACWQSNRAESTRGAGSATLQSVQLRPRWVLVLSHEALPCACMPVGDVQGLNADRCRRPALDGIFLEHGRPCHLSLVCLLTLAISFLASLVDMARSTPTRTPNAMQRGAW